MAGGLMQANRITRAAFAACYPIVVLAAWAGEIRVFGQDAMLGENFFDPWREDSRFSEGERTDALPGSPAHPMLPRIGPEGAGLASLPITPSTTGERRFEEENLIVNLPGGPWHEVDLRQFNPHARLVLARENGTCIMLVCERVGVEMNADVHSLAQLARAQARQQHPDVRFSNDWPEAGGGMDGLAFEATATVNGRWVYLLYWVAVRNGYAYQLVALGDGGFASSVGADARDMRDRLRQIEPDRVARTGSEVSVVRNHESKPFGYKVDLSNQIWVRVNKSRDLLPGADLFVATNDAGMVVFPIPLPAGRKPDLDTLATVMCPRFKLEYSGDELVKKSDARIGSLPARELDFDRYMDGERLRYRLRLAVDEGCAYLVGAWGIGEHESAFERACAAMDTTQFGVRSPIHPGDFSEEQRAGWALLLNELCMHSTAKGDYMAALDYISLAAQYAPDNETVLENQVAILAELDRVSEATALLDSRLPHLPESLALRALQAELLVKAGRVDQACRTYAELFQRGYVDEDALFRYMSLAIEAESYDEAIAAAEAVMSRKPTLRVQRWHASVFGFKGEHAKSIAMLRDLYQRHPANVELAVELADAYSMAEDYPAALQITQQLIDSGNRGEAVLLRHGRSQMQLEQFAQAKHTFQHVTELYPRNEEAQQLLRLVAGVLGQGDNTALNTPIEAVPIPQVVRDRIQNTTIRELPDVAKYGAEQMTRITGISFQPGKPLRTTTYVRIKIHSPSAVATFGNLQFELNPLVERAYVNRLVVLDEQGKQVAEGSVDSYYVIDDTASGMATNEKLANVPVPGLKPGYTLEYIMTRESLVPEEEFGFRQVTLSTGVPVGVSAFFVQGDLSGLRWRESVPLDVRSSGELLHCVVTNPNPYRHESKQAPIEDFLPVIWIGSADASWEALGRKYLAKIDAQLALDEETRQIATELTKGCRTNREKLAAITSFVQQSITYQGIEFGRRAQVPNPAAKTLQLKYGDCKDHSLLVKQLLNAVRIPAHLALARTEGRLIQDLPALDQFDHMIAYVPGATVGEPENPIGGLLLDATNKDADMLLSPIVGMPDTSFLVLDPHQPRLVRTASYSVDAGRVACRRDVTIRTGESATDEVTVHVREHVTLNNYAAPRIRGLLRMFEAGERQNAVQQLISQEGQIRIQRLEVANLDCPTKPLELTLEYELPDSFHRIVSGGRPTLVGKLPSGWESCYLQSEYVDSRETPFEISMPLLVESSAKIHLPVGYQLASAGASQGSAQSMYAAWASSCSQAGNDVNIEYRLRLAAGRHSAAAYNDYYAAMKRSLAPLQTPLAISQSSAEVATLPRAEPILVR